MEISSPYRLATATFVGFSTLFALSGSCARAQQSDRRQFEVVSVKPSQAIGGGAISVESQYAPTSVTLRGITLDNLILRAYSLRRYQLSGPSWIESANYDILAKTSERSSRQEHYLMLQDVLSTRFRMAAHFETRAMRAYQLQTAEGGFKMKPSTSDATEARLWNSAGIKLEHASMEQFASMLSGKVNRPVLDKTGISGAFDFDLTWAPLTADLEAEVGPSVFAALRPLGLMLQSARSPVRVLVIDHIEKPSAD